MHLRHNFLSLLLYFIMVFAVMNAPVLKSMMSTAVTEQALSTHQHDADMLENEYSSLLHNHGNVHHLNADHSHDVNKLFALTSLSLFSGNNRVSYLPHSLRALSRTLPVPERPPRLQPV